MYLLHGHALKAAMLEIWRRRLRDEINSKRRSVTKLSKETNLILLEHDSTPPKKWLFQNRSEYKERNLLKEFLFDDESLWMPESAQRDNLCRVLEVWESIGGREIPYRIEPSRLFPVNTIYNRMLDRALLAEGLAVLKIRNGSQMLFSTPKLEKLKKFKYAVKIYDIVKEYE